MIKDINTFNVINVHAQMLFSFFLSFVMPSILTIENQKLPQWLSNINFIGILPSVTGMSQYLE